MKSSTAILIFAILVSIPIFGKIIKDMNGNEKTMLQKEFIEETIEQYIASNPGAILKVLINHQQSEMDKEINENFQNALLENENAIYNNTNTPFVGSANANDVIVEFFDYSCGYCKKNNKEINKLLKERNIKVIFKEVPILGDSSYFATKSAITVFKTDPEKYHEFHNLLINEKEQYNADMVGKILEKANVRIDLYKSNFEKNIAKKEIEANIELAQRLGLQGTPAFIINKKLYRGFMTYDNLVEALDKK